MGKKFFFTIVLMTITANAALASFIERYNISYLDMQDGMPGNYVDDMIRDSYGFVWICNYGGGLLRYDGYSFQPSVPYGGAMTVGSYSCRNACEDKFKRLWVAFDDGIQVINLKTRLRADLSYKGKSISNILNQPAVKTCCDAKGGVWLVTRAYIYYIRFDNEGKIVEILKRNYAVNVPDLVVKDIDQDGSVIVPIDNGLYRLRPNNGKLVKTEYASELAEVGRWFIMDITHFAGCTWLATNNGLYSLNNADRKLQHYSASRKNMGHSLSHDFVTSLAVADNNTLLVGTLNGVDILDVHSGTFSVWNSHSAVNPLTSDFVNCLMLLGNQIWVGTETGGIVKLVPRELELKSYVHNGSQGCLSPNCVNAMYAEPDGTLWVGTVDGGLNRKPRGDSQFTHFTTQNSALSHNSVSTLAADNRRRLWIGTWGGGVCTIGLDGSLSIKRLAVNPKIQQRLNFIGALAYDKYNDGMWIGANEGLYFYDLKHERICEPFKGCDAIRGCIGSIVEKNGHLWVGCMNGAVEINLHKKHIMGKGYYNFVDVTSHRYKLDNPKSGVIEKLSCFLQTNDGTLWLGSNEYGLYRRTIGQKGEAIYKAYTMKDGLANNSVKGIVEDKNGMIWITTNNGLSKLNPKTGLFTNYTVDDGLLTNQFYWNSAISSLQGTIYLGSNKGLIEFSGYKKVQGKRPSQLRFTHITIDNQEITTGSGHLDEDVSIAKTLKLNEWNKSFEIDFSALNYYHEKTGIYSYRLKGFENDWLQLPPGQHSVRYTNLPNGTYTFEVKYSSGDVDGHVDAAAINIKVIPYFYKQPWFVALFVLTLTIITVLVYKRHIERLRQKEADILFEPIRQTLTETTEPEKLRERIRSIIDNQNRYKESYVKTARDNEDQNMQKAEPFMDKVIRIMEQNYMNSDFGVTELSEQMGMTKAMLSKKMHIEIGQATTRFICNYRLNIARELLLKNTTNRNIAEIAFSVGFNDPKYFTRCFTREYGVAPNKYMKE